MMRSITMGLKMKHTQVLEQIENEMLNTEVEIEGQEGAENDFDENAASNQG